MSTRGQPLPGDDQEGAELSIQAVGSTGQVAAAEGGGWENPAPCPANATAPTLQAGQGEDERSTAEAQRIDQENAYNPFISHDFLLALEESGSGGGRPGWRAA